MVFENRKNIEDKLKALHAHRRISNSLKSDEVLYHNRQDTFDTMAEGKDYRREDLKWEKIRTVLQNNKNDILLAFGAEKSTAPSAFIVRSLTIILSFPFH